MGLLEHAQEQRLLAPGTDLPAAAALFVGSVQGLVMHSLISGEVRAMTQQAPAVFTIYLRGLAATGSAQKHLTTKHTT